MGSFLLLVISVAKTLKTCGLSIYPQSIFCCNRLKFFFLMLSVSILFFVLLCVCILLYYPISILISTKSVQGLPFLHILTSIYYLSLFFKWWSFQQMGGDVSLWFWFTFHYRLWCWISFHVLTGHLNAFFRQMSIQALCLFFELFLFALELYEFLLYSG